MDFVVSELCIAYLKVFKESNRRVEDGKVIVENIVFYSLKGKIGCIRSFSMEGGWKI